MPKPKKPELEFDGFARVRIYRVKGKVTVTFELENDKADKFMALLKTHEAKEKS